MTTNPPQLPPPAANKDAEHLKLLATFHTVVAIIGAIFACFPLLHVGLGAMMVFRPELMTEGQNQPPPAWFGLIFMVMGLAFVLAGWAMAGCTFLSGRYLAKRRRRTFSFVVAALLCLFIPFGTVLGIFTIIVLSRESVQRLYEAAPATGAA